MEKKKTEEETEQEIRKGELDEDIYEKEGREELEEDGEISPEEEGFMQGYDEGEKMAECAKCKKVLVQDFTEKEIDDEIYRFCSEKCAESFRKHKEE